MIYEDDYILRQVNALARALARVIFNKENTEYIPGEGSVAADGLYRELSGLIDRGRIGDAEDLLFEKMAKGDKAMLMVAVDFYARLCRLSGEELERGGFSEEEIEKGLRDAADVFGVPASLLEIM